MEPVAILEMYKMLFTGYSVIVKSIVTDDDSSIKATMKWSNNDTMENLGTDKPPMVVGADGKETVRPDKGKIPKHMPEPLFLADPNHRKKTFGKSMFQLAGLKVDKKMTMTKMDSYRLQTNFAYMGRSLSGKTDEEMLYSSKAVVEHHFDCHDFCGDWCNRKKNMDNDSKKKYYRSKEKDILLYNKLQARIARFITLKGLKEISHCMDMLANESLNNTIAWYAPKNKAHSSSESLKN